MKDVVNIALVGIAGYGEFYVENLTNQYYNITGFAVPEQTGNYAGYPGYPRFYGARVRFGF